MSLKLKMKFELYSTDGQRMHQRMPRLHSATQSDDDELKFLISDGASSFQGRSVVMAKWFIWMVEKGQSSQT